jgi:hypothetical protein
MIDHYYQSGDHMRGRSGASRNMHTSLYHSELQIHICTIARLSPAGAIKDALYITAETL